MTAGQNQLLPPPKFLLTLFFTPSRPRLPPPPPKSFDSPPPPKGEILQKILDWYCDSHIQGFLQARFFFGGGGGGWGGLPLPKKNCYSPQNFLTLFPVSRLPLDHSPLKSFNALPKGEILQEILMFVSILIVLTLLV